METLPDAPPDYQVQDFIDAPLPPLDAGDRQLNQRTAYNLTVTLWLAKNSLNETYVTVHDADDDSSVVFPVPDPGLAKDVFLHPYTYKPEDDDGRGTN